MNDTMGMVHLYTGDGKGKTSAAALLALRSLGHGRRVLFAQFIKGRDSGELEGLRKLGAHILRAMSSDKFISQMDEEERKTTRKEHTAAFDMVRIHIRQGDYDVVILDEVVGLVELCILSLPELLDAIKERPAGMELILTGHNPPGELLGLCDYHTEFVCKKHPFQRGVPARQGIEY